MKVFKPGDKFGTSIFIEEVERKTKYIRRARMECKCGKIYEADLFAIKIGSTKTCGCMRSEFNRCFKNYEVQDIRKLIWDEDMILQDIANIYNVAVSTIWNIKNGKTYKNA